MRHRSSALVLGAITLVVLGLAIPGSLRAGIEGVVDLLVAGILLDADSKGEDDP